MAKSNNTLCLDKFYPERDLMITDIAQQSDKIIIRMKSTSSSCKCPKSVILLLPLTCHIPVRPGRKDIRALWCGSYNSHSSTVGGLVPKYVK